MLISWIPLSFTLEFSGAARRELVPREGVHERNRNEGELPSGESESLSEFSLPA